MKSLQEDIKNQEFKKVYLLCGEEDYLKKQYKEKLKNALVPDGDTMNFSIFEGKKTEPRAVIDLGETMPFFAERRVIFLEDTGFFKNQCQDLPEYLGELPDYLCMVFVESEVDKPVSYTHLECTFWMAELSTVCSLKSLQTKGLEPLF